MSDEFTSALADGRSRVWARVLIGVAAGLACAVTGFAFLLVPLPGTTAEAAALGKGIVDYRLEQPSVDASAIPGMIAEMGQGNLGARWTRILVHWSALQPFAPGTSYSGDVDRDGYADAYVAQLDDIVGQLSAAHISIVMTPLDVPEWASDSRLWSRPPSSAYTRGAYYPFYAPDMRSGSLAGAQFKALGTFLAARYDGSAGHGKVGYFEAWNEPNQGTYLYPQTPTSARNGGGATYLKMLEQWYKGVNAPDGDPSAVVIGGSTAPRGRGDAGSTPPQAFARYLKTKGASRYMDAYSHHPYTPGGSTHVAPSQLPNNPDRCVTLGNLSQLTRLFPTKPFYLTEFGYNTEYSKWFGVAVSTADQARFLRQAYSYTASRYKKVKALLWFMVDDMAAAPGAAKSTGVYMGVRTADGERKPSWYAFAGSNKLTLVMPTSARAGKPIPVSGVLTYRQPADAASQTLTLQARSPSGSAWKTVATVKTDATTGAYSRSVKQSRTKVYRIVWGGVCESASHAVRTP